MNRLLASIRRWLRRSPPEDPRVAPLQKGRATAVPVRR